MSITVIVPTYNRAHLLDHSLGSLIAQTRAPEQIIVVDDGSADDTEIRVRKYLDRVEYLRKPNGGKSSAINLALQRATGEYIWIFDDDDVAFQDALERHLNVLEDPEIGFTYSSYIRCVEKPDGSLEPGDDAKTPKLTHRDLFCRLLESNFICHPSMVVRASCYREVGPYDESLPRSQDYEMVLRLARKFRADMIDGPTYFRRYNEDLRGPARDRFVVRDYGTKAHKYEKVIFERLYDGLDLREYLPRDCVWNRRQALLNRMAVMAVRGLWDKASRDLIEASRIPGQLTSEEVRSLWSAMRNPLGLGDLKDLERVRCGGRMQHELAKGIYYAVRKEDLPLREKARLCGMIARLVSLSGVIRDIKSKQDTA